MLAKRAGVQKCNATIAIKQCKLYVEALNKHTFDAKISCKNCWIYQLRLALSETDMLDNQTYSGSRITRLTSM